MAKIKTYLHPHTNVDGTKAIWVSLYLHGKKVRFNTQVTCKEEKFDNIKGRIKGNTKEVKDNNLIVQNCVSRINDIQVKYRLRNKELTPDLLKTEYKNPTYGLDFIVFLEDAIKERSKDMAATTTSQHRVLISKLKQFKDDISFSEITPDFILNFQRFLKHTLKNDVGTTYNALKNLRTYINVAIRKELIEKNPFQDVNLKRNSTTERVHLTAEERNKIWVAYNNRISKIPDGLIKYMRWFLFMCYTGLRISDLRKIEKSDIINNILVYVPHKTSAQKKETIKLPLISKSQQLIKDEKNNCNNLLFNCCSEQKMNTKIKEVVKILGIRKKVTNHTARHTFATLFYETTNDVAVLQKLLGHSKITQTMIYVHITDKKINEQMQVFEDSI